jgi:CYTH domain-containing protein
MALEIERRFLVISPVWRTQVAWQRQLQQGYLSQGADGLTLRVRISSASTEPAAAWLTLKAPPIQPQAGPDGLVRQEFEYPIPLADAQAMLALTAQQVSKRRYGLALGGGNWVVDVFDGANHPLVVAEVELEHAEQGLEVPSWCGPELTGRHELSNAALARRPFSDWDAEQRQPLVRALHGLE